MLEADARFAVVLTHNRPDLLEQSVRAAASQADLVLVVDNASDPPAQIPAGLGNAMLVLDGQQPPNLSALWNLGFGLLAEHRPDSVERWDIALLCDDAVLPDGWWDAVSTTMRAHNCAAGSTHAITPVTAPIVKTAPDSDISNRMCGWAFMVAGELRPLADERMQWWWCDTDLDWQARRAGGMVIAPGPVVPNLRPNDYTNAIPHLGARTVVDRDAFAAKWGSAPW